MGGGYSPPLATLLKYTLKLRNQIIIKHACGEGLRYMAFLHHLISLRVEVAQISDFLVHAKILPL